MKRDWFKIIYQETKHLVLCALLLFFLAAGRADADAPRLLYQVRIPFVVGQSVSATLPDGRSFDLGNVVKLPTQTRWPSYTASAWAKPGTVAASAVNALHLLVDVEDGKGRTMSVIPSETIAPAAGAGASVVVDAPAGTNFFGAWAPPVGTPVFVEAADSFVPLSPNSLPKHGDVLVFKIYEGDLPYMLEIENRPGGRAVAWSKNGAYVIARVIRPVAGVGRFEGTLFQDAGRIRANHTGVIDVSTCPRGRTGGFQLIPWDHAMDSREMQGAWGATQWMILGPSDGKSPMGGTAPLFSDGLVPGTFHGEKLWHLWATYGRKPLVLARIHGGPWRHLPIAEGKADEILIRITHLRIYFPWTKEPLADL